MSENLETNLPNYLTVRQLPERHPAFTQGGIRALIFNAEKNGFHKCLRRCGRKILIDEKAFFEWLETQNAEDGHAA